MRGTVDRNINSGPHCEEPCLVAFWRPAQVSKCHLCCVPPIAVLTLLFAIQARVPLGAPQWPAPGHHDMTCLGKAFRALSPSARWQASRGFIGER